MTNNDVHINKIVHTNIIVYITELYKISTAVFFNFKENDFIMLYKTTIFLECFGAPAGPTLLDLLYLLQAAAK